MNKFQSWKNPYKKLWVQLRFNIDNDLYKNIANKGKLHQVLDDIEKQYYCYSEPDEFEVVLRKDGRVKGYPNPNALDETVNDLKSYVYHEISGLENREIESWDNPFKKSWMQLRFNVEAGEYEDIFDIKTLEWILDSIEKAHNMYREPGYFQSMVKKHGLIRRVNPSNANDRLQTMVDELNREARVRHIKYEKEKSKKKTLFQRIFRK